VYEGSRAVRITEPYIPGYLAFREAPHFVDLVDQLRREHPELSPDVWAMRCCTCVAKMSLFIGLIFAQVLFVDGNGLLHHQGMYKKT
jgi:deoxyinosine 3'endonuclease (endonuclease V)